MTGWSDVMCDRCGERKASIHLTQIVDNTVTTAHLCEACAADQGVKTGEPGASHPLSGFVGAPGPGAAAVLTGGVDAGPCSFCGASLGDFRETGRLGCPHCYAAFEPQLRELLRRIHGASQHVGRLYLGAAAPATAEVPKLLAVWREQLRRAIDTENFELAAELRDRIRGLE
ncbi:MAG: hypothetical protein AMS20_16505 [Gemmatimonas sp. SG8_28]|nr:MAG: hypothetical protein AMS20_16505 [Gemmatimonas sp. SG8_28]